VTGYPRLHLFVAHLLIYCHDIWFVQHEVQSIQKGNRGQHPDVRANSHSEGHSERSFVTFALQKEFLDVFGRLLGGCLLERAPNGMPASMNHQT
jgi:hypothetical protein